MVLLYLFQEILNYPNCVVNDGFRFIQITAHIHSKHEGTNIILNVLERWAVRHAGIDRQVKLGCLGVDFEFGPVSTSADRTIVLVFGTNDAQFVYKSFARVTTKVVDAAPRKRSSNTGVEVFQWAQCET